MRPDVAPIRGPFHVRKADTRREPVRHKHFSAAEAEAERLASLDPGATYVIAQDVAIVSQNGHQR